MSGDDTLLAECARALEPILDQFLSFTATDRDLADIETRLARAVLAIARPIIESEALERAAKRCERFHDPMADHLSDEIRKLKPATGSLRGDQA